MMNEREETAAAPSYREGFASPARVAPAPRLPDEPLIKIRPGGSRAASDLKELWAHRELLYFLVWRDLKLRYKQTALGASWAVLQPVLMALVFTVFMGKLARVPSDGVPYPVFVYAGLLPWTFFSSSVSTSGYSLLANSQLITKVFFPRMLIHLALTGVRLADLLIAVVVLLAMMFYYGIGVRWGILLLPALVALATLLTVAVGLLFSALIVKRRDVGTLLPVLLQAWMFASPVIYPSRLVPQRWRLVYSLNPLAGIVDGVRASLFGLAFDWKGMTISSVVTLLLLAYSVRAFLRVEENLADII